MATGSAIASRLTTDEFDVDGVAQLALLRGTAPQTVLDLLFVSIRGECGSMYYDMTERRTRCVTINYADKMHVDFTPMIRLAERPERVSHLFHSKPEDRNDIDRTLVANPYGFASGSRPTRRSTTTSPGSSPSARATTNVWCSPRRRIRRICRTSSLFR